MRDKWNSIRDAHNGAEFVYTMQERFPRGASEVGLRMRICSISPARQLAAPSIHSAVYARQSLEFSTCFCFCLDDAGYHHGRLAIFGLAGKFEADAVRIIKVDAEQSWELRNRPDILDTAVSQPRLDFPEPLGRDDKGEMLHGTDGVPVSGWFFAARDLERREGYHYPYRRK